MRTAALAVLALASISCLGSYHSIAPPYRTPATATERELSVPTRAEAVPYLEFHNDFWINLHHFLNAQARAKLGPANTRYPLMQAVLVDSPRPGFSTETALADWTEAVSLYTETVSKWDITADSQLVDLNYHLASMGSSPTLSIANDPQIPGAIRKALVLAAPAYETRWWPTHSAANRNYIATMKNLLSQSNGEIQRRISFALGQEWRPRSRVVEVVRYADWTGMYRNERPTLITMSSLYGTANQARALERIYTAAAETETDSLRVALKDAGLKPETPEVRELVSFIVRYTAGDAVREMVPGYVMTIDSLPGFRSGSPTGKRGSAAARWAHVRQVIEKAWAPHLKRGTAVRAAAVAIAREY